MSKNGWPIENGRHGLPVWRLNRVVSLIYKKTSGLEETNREIPLVWSNMHSLTTMQLAKLVALKRNLDPELAGLVCVFHDIYTFITGSTEDHGPLAESYIREIIQEYNTTSREELAEITEAEQQTIINAVKGHSDKLTTDSNPYAKLIKDVDSLDSYLTGMSPGRRSGRIPRINELLAELAIDHSIN